MSQENVEAANVELVRAYYPALNQRDLDGVLNVFAEEAEYRPFNVSVVEGGSYSGHDGIKRWFAEAAETWEYLRAEPDTYRAGGDRVVVIGHLRVRGKQSGVDVDSPAAWVWTISDGKALEMRVFLDPVEALEAAGLSE